MRFSSYHPFVNVLDSVVGSDDLQTHVLDDGSRSNVVGFCFGKDVTEIEQNGIHPSVERVVQPSFDGREIHRVRTQIRVDWRSKRFRNFQFHHLAQCSRDPFAFWVAISSPIFRSRSVQCPNNLGWQHWNTTNCIGSPVFIDGLQIPRTQTVRLWFVVPSNKRY